MRTLALASLVAVVLGCEGPVHVETGPDADLLFLVQSTPPLTVLQALYQGRVNVDQEGCFRLSAESGGATVVWPFGTTLAREKVGLVVLDEGGRELVSIGDNVRLGGGEVADLGALELLSGPMLAAALDRCPGVFWIVGEVLPPQAR